MLAYQRARLPWEYSLAEAYFLREAALTQCASSQTKDSERISAHLRAAEAFRVVARDASDCVERSTYYRESAECFLRANTPVRAAQCYEQAEEYKASAEQYRLCGLFDDAVRVVMAHREEIKSDATVRSIVNVSAFFYLQDGHVS